MPDIKTRVVADTSQAVKAIEDLLSAYNNRKINLIVTANTRAISKGFKKPKQYIAKEIDGIKKDSSRKLSNIFTPVLDRKLVNNKFSKPLQKAVGSFADSLTRAGNKAIERTINQAVGLTNRQLKSNAAEVLSAVEEEFNAKQRRLERQSKQQGRQSTKNAGNAVKQVRKNNDKYRKALHQGYRSVDKELEKYENLLEGPQRKVLNPQAKHGAEEIQGKLRQDKKDYENLLKQMDRESKRQEGKVNKRLGSHSGFNVQSNIGRRSLQYVGDVSDDLRGQIDAMNKASARNLDDAATFQRANRRYFKSASETAKQRNQEEKARKKANEEAEKESARHAKAEEAEFQKWKNQRNKEAKAAGDEYAKREQRIAKERAANKQQESAFADEVREEKALYEKQRETQKANATDRQRDVEAAFKAEKEWQQKRNKEAQAAAQEQAKRDKASSQERAEYLKQNSAFVDEMRAEQDMLERENKARAARTEEKKNDMKEALKNQEVLKRSEVMAEKERQAAINDIREGTAKQREKELRDAQNADRKAERERTREMTSLARENKKIMEASTKSNLAFEKNVGPGGAWKAMLSNNEISAWRSQYEGMKKTYSDLQALGTQIQKSGKVTPQQMQQFKELSSAMATSDTALKHFNATYTEHLNMLRGSNNEAVYFDKMGAKMSDYYNKFGHNLQRNSALYDKFINLQERANTGQFKSIADANRQWASFRTEARRAGVEIDTFGLTLVP